MIKKVIVSTLVALTLLSMNVNSSQKATNLEKSEVLLTEQNTVNLRGVIDSQSTTRVMLELARLDTLRGSKDYPIYLVLNSPGGSVQDGLTFIQYTKTIKNLKTITIFAASMASAIAQHLPAERLITENGTMMFHRARGGFEGQFNDGEVEQQLNFWKSIINDMEEKSASRMGMTLKEYKEKVRDEYWIYGKNNLEQNAADRLVTIKCSEKLLKEREIGEVQVFIFSAEAEFSKCPLIEAPLKLLK